MTSTSSVALPSDCLALELPETLDRELDLRIAVVQQTAEFSAMRDEWNELLSSSRSDCLFLTWEWLHTWWTHLGRGKRLFLVTVRSGGQLVVVAPLTVTRAWVGPFAIPLLEFAGTGSIGSDYLDFIARPGCETAAVQALTDFLAATGLSIRLPRVKEDSLVATALGQGLSDRGWECLQVPTDVCPFIDLSAGSWDSYLSSLGPRHRYNYRRRLRSLAKGYEVRLVQADSEQNRREALQHLVTLHLQRWQKRGGSKAFDNPGVLAFHQELTRLAREQGWLRLLVLLLDGQAAAAFYGFRYGRTFYFYQSGFDPAFRRHSVGLVSMGLSIRNAIEEGADEYDLLHGDERYKFLWTTQVRPLLQLECYPPGFRGRIHRNTARWSATAKILAKRALLATGVPAALTTLD